MAEHTDGIASRVKSLPAALAKRGYNSLHLLLSETFGLSPVVTLCAMIFVGCVIVGGVFWFFHSAPPDTIVMTGGDEGSRFQKNAEKYAQILARNGVKLKILPSDGSLENLKRMADPSFKVDIGFVQAGLAKGRNIDNLVSLGSVGYIPLFIFYRGDQNLDLLSQFSGKRLAIGEEGTGTHVLALELLAMNGIKPGGTTALLELDDDASQAALLTGKADAAFMMSDSASGKIMRDLVRNPDIKLFDFSQADGYTRRISYLNKTVLPKGCLDFGKNIPDRDIRLVSPTVELVARSNLHPALSDLILEAAEEVHGRATLLQRRGEFPVPLEHEYPISADAARYYKSGKSFLYRYFPFWIASLLNRILVVFVPMILILIPGLRFIPAIFRWQIRLRILRWYRQMMVLEKDLEGPVGKEKSQELLARLDQIEQTVNRTKVPASYADQFYALRGHIGLIRDRLKAEDNGRIAAEAA